MTNSIEYREKIIDTAKSVVCNGRENQYGGPEENFKLIAEVWSTKLREIFKKRDTLTPHDVAMLMIDLKLVRILTGNMNEDNWVDIIGYAACGAACQKVEKSNE